MAIELIEGGEQNATTELKLSDIRELILGMENENTEDQTENEIKLYDEIERFTGESEGAMVDELVRFINKEDHAIEADKQYAEDLATDAKKREETLDKIKTAIAKYCRGKGITSKNKKAGISTAIWYSESESVNENMTYKDTFYSNTITIENNMLKLVSERLIDQGIDFSLNNERRLNKGKVKKAIKNGYKVLADSYDLVPVPDDFTPIIKTPQLKIGRSNR
jgi:hypothetical protein